MAFDIEHFPTSAAAKRMLDRVSPIYEQSYVGKWIYQVMGLEIDEARLAFEELRLQAFPETATWGLRYWEDRYGLPTDEARDLEERRAELLSRRGARAPMNPARVENIISSLLNLPVFVTEDVAPYTFAVEIATGERVVDLLRAYERLLEIKPSHQAVQLITRHKTMDATARLGAGMMLFSITPLPELPEDHSFMAQASIEGGAQITSRTTLPEMAEAHPFITTAQVAAAAQAATYTPLPEYEAPKPPLRGTWEVNGAGAIITSTALPEI